jgi:hypothetical protein
MSMQDVRGDWRAAAEWQIATEIYPLSPKDRKDQGMKAYLRTVKARVSGNTRDVTQAANDVTLDVSDDSFLDEGEAIEGVISMGNGGHKNVAYVQLSYPTVELLNFGNLDFAATIVEPTKGLPGLVPVGTRIKFDVQ